MRDTILVDYWKNEDKIKEMECFLGYNIDYICDNPNQFYYEKINELKQLLLNKRELLKQLREAEKKVINFSYFKQYYAKC